MKSHKNIPVFVVHEGCPHKCVFCSQGTITGKGNVRAEIESVREKVAHALETAQDSETEIAFFGGSFTGIERSRMVALLECAHRFVQEGKACGIRLSTRPDYIDRERLDILRDYGVTAIELGVQSMDDRVLAVSERGHTADDTRKAFALINEYGVFEPVGQMMTGLPESTPELEEYTAREIVSFGCRQARVYPTVVMPGTKLWEMERAGVYTAPDAENMIARCARVLNIFRKNGVKVIRLGLQDVPDIRECEKYDSAFGERVWSRLYLDEVLRQAGRERAVDIFVPKRYISRLVGQKRENIEKLKDMYGFEYIKIKACDGVLPENGLVRVAVIGKGK